MKIGRAMLAPTINVISVKNSVFYIKKGDLTVSSKISVLKLILKGCPFKSKSLKWLRGIDSNYRPQGYEPCELPTAPSRDVNNYFIIRPFLLNVNTNSKIFVLKNSTCHNLQLS